jgi:hypothetical protein
MDITIRIKLINRFKPQGLADYKRSRAMKLPVRSRSNDEDHLNIFAKKLKNVNTDRLSQAVSEEVIRIKELANFQIKDSADYGDKLIGKIEVWGYSDWYFPCFIPVGSNKNGSTSSPTAASLAAVEDKSQLKLF